MPVIKYKCKRRPRGFLGTPRHFVRPAPQSPEVLEAEEEEETLEESPIPLETGNWQSPDHFLPLVGPLKLEQASALDVSSSSESDCDEPLEEHQLMKGYRLVDCESLGRAVSDVGVCDLSLPTCCVRGLQSEEGDGVHTKSLLLQQ